MACDIDFFQCQLSCYIIRQVCSTIHCFAQYTRTKTNVNSKTSVIFTNDSDFHLKYLGKTVQDIP